MTERMLTDKDWQAVFRNASECLGEGGRDTRNTSSWCAWTTFERLQEDVGYWKNGLPKLDEILPTYIADGSVFGSPLSYQDIAHLIIPARFYWEKFESDYQSGFKQQDIVALSARLKALRIPHRLTKIVLEIKLY